MAGIFPTSKGRLLSCAEEGQWGEVLEILDCLDVERYRKNYLDDYCKSKGDDDAKETDSIVTPLQRALALAHEMTVLELADHGEYELAYGALRMCSEMLDKSLPSDNSNDMDDDVEQESGKGSGTLGTITSRTGDIERRITALTSLRSSPSNDGVGLDLPVNYYGPSNQTQQKRRSQIAKLLKQNVPELPLQRLSSLLQQSIKWQCHTGVYPTVQRLFQEDDLDENEGGIENEGQSKKKRRKKHATEQKFDLVLGNVDISIGSGKKKHKSSSGRDSSERIPSRPTQTIRLGKKSYIESAKFLPDGRGLVTGSSDGFIEIWGEAIRDGAEISTQNEIDFEKLRTSDLPFQKSDDLMMHDAPVLAMDVSHDGNLLGTASSDGIVCVWKIMDGKLLRKLERAHGKLFIEFI
jgi:WD40 repeat-containing protein SMU1